jgi:hypothetical protein
LYLHKEKGLAWTTVSTKVKQAMQGVLKYGRKEEFLPADFDPFRDIGCEASSDYEAITCTPEQTLAILNQLDEPEFILTLVIAATGLSISEALGLQWADVEYERNRIVVRRSCHCRSGVGSLFFCCSCVVYGAIVVCAYGESGSNALPIDDDCGLSSCAR